MQNNEQFFAINWKMRRAEEIEVFQNKLDKQNKKFPQNKNEAEGA
jgi:hypothetical protein